MKQKAFIAELRSAGCYLLRHGAGHDIWFSPITGKKFSLPRHGSQELSKGLEQRARKELGI
jgi:hypothetical protein